MEDFFGFITKNIVAIGTMAAAALVIMAYIANQRFKLWVVDFWATFPVIGTIARLSRDKTKGNNGWLRAEEKLCAAYKPFVNLITRRMFDQRIEYMRKSADLGRTPTPMWAWFLLVILVIAEGMGFSYLLGSWMAREGSANTHTLLMFAIVLVLCVILVALTHFAGHQYYRTSLLRSCFARYKERGSDEYSVHTVALKDDQDIDSREPDFKQTINRVGKHSHDVGSYAGGIIAIIAIAFISIVSTYMLVQNMEAEMARVVTGEAHVASSSQASGNPFDALLLPESVTSSQNAADSQAKNEEMNAFSKEGLAAFAMLGFIFVITQIVGMGTGYKYGFAGRESDQAFKATGGFSTYEDYLSYYRPLRDMVNGRLKDLQQRIESKSHTKLSLNKSFDDFLREQRAQEMMEDPLTESNPAPETHPAVQPAVPVSAPVHTQPAVTATPPSAPAAPVEAPAPTLAAVQQEMLRLNNADAEKAYFLSLPDSMRSNPALLTWLKERKAVRAAAVQANDLF